MMCRLLFIALFAAGSRDSETDSRDLLNARTSTTSNTPANSSSHGLFGVVSKEVNNARLKVAQEAGLDWFYNWNPSMAPITDTSGLTFHGQQWGLDNSGWQQPG